MSTKEPWEISNALAALREVRDRENPGGAPEKRETIRLAMDYAIEVVKGINAIRPPEPPDPRVAADNAVRQFCRDLGQAFRDLGDALETAAGKKE